MKKLLFIILAVFTIQSCDILEPDPLTALDANAALVDGTSANAILLGAYSRMQNINYYGLEYVLNNDLIADNARYQGFFDSQLEIDQRAVPFTNLWITQAWPNIYRVINITNLLITGVPALEDATFSQAARNRVLGEAHAIRALAYFDLLRIYGEFFNESSTFGVPLLIEPIENNDFNRIPNLARNSVAQVYTQIMSDINSAVDLLPGVNDKGRMNFWAALSLRARVQLYRGNYTQAFDDADRVITEGPSQLLTNVRDIYVALTPTAESIFDLEFNDQDQSSFNTYIIRRDEYNVDPSLLDAFEDGDTRADLFSFSRNSFRSAKYPDNNNGNNTKVFRLAEIYFIRAEAAVFTNSDPNAGLADLNTIRERAGLQALTGFGTTDAFVDAILQERRVELNYEGHRFFDLVRYNRIGTVLGMPDFRRVWPIPRDELLVSQGVLVQNPGYETL
ncbi:RagB/SusD family nutrient uptake outer membrane protein [Mongoliitalea daihaiensis]|uniref:RagB/SusD family nutrient uptake outer membrane protein n=1 Tax=Mongoliitalea daihaiensis TaxID=2782006 RepID=UPI001F3A6EA6|nr:RagB/SusD family nutrient uptake outer membrane protein [Mongoliitalea daihaiensis]UJP64635.1 RagB/SusD family nutrient uptake outer membrane protein [Mongoliitalea daihaiensis]